MNISRTVLLKRLDKKRRLTHESMEYAAKSQCYQRACEAQARLDTIQEIHSMIFGWKETLNDEH